MDKEEIKRRINRRIDADSTYAANIQQALDTADEYLLLQLIADVIGFIIDIASSAWQWIKRQFS